MISLKNILVALKYETATHVSKIIYGQKRLITAFSTKNVLIINNFKNLFIYLMSELNEKSNI